jgi:hypothetical protein
VYAEIQAVDEWNEPDGRGKSMRVNDDAPLVRVVEDGSTWHVHLAAAFSEQRSSGVRTNSGGRATNRYLSVDLTPSDVVAIVNAVLNKGLLRVDQANAATEGNDG